MVLKKIAGKVKNMLEICKEGGGFMLGLLTL
jgi:hypothetical protein